MIKTHESRATVATLLAGLSFLAGPTLAEGFDQSALIKPATQIDLVFIPKVVHPWYDVVEQGAEYAIEELARRQRPWDRLG
jgi:ribose transport system substrate-binding protein